MGLMGFQGEKAESLTIGSPMQKSATIFLPPLLTPRQTTPALPNQACPKMSLYYRSQFHHGTRVQSDFGRRFVETMIGLAELLLRFVCGAFNINPASALQKPNA